MRCKIQRRIFWIPPGCGESKSPTGRITGRGVSLGGSPRASDSRIARTDGRSAAVIGRSGEWCDGDSVLSCFFSALRIFHFPLENSRYSRKGAAELDRRSPSRPLSPPVCAASHRINPLSLPGERQIGDRALSLSSPLCRGTMICARNACARPRMGIVCALSGSN